MACERVKPTYNCYCILVLTALKIATRVAETCRWLLCNKIMFMNQSASVCTFNKFCKVKVKVKQSLYRSAQALRVPEG